MNEAATTLTRAELAVVTVGALGCLVRESRQEIARHATDLRTAVLLSGYKQRRVNDLRRHDGTTS